MQNFVGIFVLKYLCRLGLPQEYITTKVYTLQKCVEKMEDYARDLCKSVYAAFMCIATSLRQLLGKCFAVKKN